jgi:ABC-type transport system involved in multi-copper enzyme maturation permease subunit
MKDEKEGRVRVEESVQQTGVKGADSMTAAASTARLHPSSFLLHPSRVRAWCYLVWLSWQRQARARQMVWIALLLLGFAVVWVAVQAQMGRWDMSHWRHPRRWGPSYAQWVAVVQVPAVFDRSPGGWAVGSALAGSCRAILASSGFLVFSYGVVFSLFLTFLLPIWSLSFATEAIGGERENNSLVWLLTRPLPRWSIYLGKFVALLPWSIGLNVGGFALMCLAAGRPGAEAFRLFWPAILAATFTFTALFYLMGACFRRPAVAAIVYSFCLEIVLGNMPGYMKRVSVGFYARCMMFEAAESYGVQPDNPGVFLPVGGTTALVVLIGATVALLALGTVIFSRAQYKEVV